MPKRLIFLFLVCFPIFCRAQSKLTGVELEIGSSAFTNSSIRNVFPAGVNLFLGPKWMIGVQEKLFVKASLGVKWYMHSLSDGYLEHLASIRLGPEFQYKAFMIGNVKFLPTFKIDFAWCTNFDTTGGIAEVFRDEPAYIISERYLRGWGIGKALGLKAELGSGWFLRLSYEILNPRFKVLNRDLQGDLGKDYIDRQHTSLALNTLNLSIGFNFSTI